MIVVTDTSVVLNLCLLQQQHLLSILFHKIFAPPAVQKEFERLVKVDPRFGSLAFPDDIRIQTPSSIHPRLNTPRLHFGEREALSLAAEIRASRVLMDEKAGRALATELGLSCIGLLGILIEARRRNLVPQLAVLLDRLQTDARFWMTPTLRLQVLQLSGELE